jgi:tetratricopeptide (TPR) repeat protein
VRRGEPPPLRALVPRVPRDLETIIQTSIAREPSHRYAGAGSLAGDLRRYLEGRPIRARRVSIAERMARWCRRNPWVTASMVLLVLGTSMSLWQAFQARWAAAATRRERDRAEAVSTFLVEIFRSPDPRQDGRQVKVADVLDRAGAKLEQEFAGSAATKGALLDALGQSYAGLGLSDRAVSLHAQARAVREAALGPVHPDTLASRHNLAVAYLKAGRLADAITLLETTLKLREAALGPVHPDTLKGRNDLAAAYGSAGRLADAITLQEATLKLSEAKLGPDHLDTLRSRHNLASVYGRAGRHTEAIPLFEATLKPYEAKLGPDHPDTLQNRHNLASAYAYTGRVSEAIALHEATLERREAKLGPDHPDTLRSRNDLALAYRSAGRLTEAVALHRATLALKEAKLGPDHLDTLASRVNLALAYRDAHRTSEASALYEATLGRIEAKLGPVHPYTLECRSGLALVYDEQLGRRAEAEGLFRDVLARRRKTVKPDSPLLAYDLTQLGRNLLEQARGSEAEPLLRECLTIREKVTPDDWRRYDAMSLLGGALLAQGRYAQAEPLVVAGYERMKAREDRIAVPERPCLLEAAERVIRLYEEWGQPDQATRWKAKLAVPDLPADVFAQP